MHDEHTIEGVSDNTYQEDLTISFIILGIHMKQLEVHSQSLEDTSS